MLGELRATGGQYSSADLTVRPDERPLPKALGEALAGIVAEAHSARLTWSPGALGRSAPVSTATAADRQLGGAHPEGAIVITQSGSFARIAGAEVARYEVKPRGDGLSCGRSLACGTRSTQLLSLEATSADDEACAPARDSLNRRYDAYVDRYGALNRFSLVRTGRRHPHTGEDLYRRARPTMGGFRHDPAYRSVMALEVFDAEAQRATKVAKPLPA